MMNFNVLGMTCGHCVRTITNGIQGIDPAARIDIDLAAKNVAVVSNAAPELLKKAIENAGYEATAKPSDFDNQAGGRGVQGCCC